MVWYGAGGLAVYSGKSWVDKGTIKWKWWWWWRKGWLLDPHAGRRNTNAEPRLARVAGPTGPTGSYDVVTWEGCQQTHSPSAVLCCAVPSTRARTGPGSSVGWPPPPEFRGCSDSGSLGPHVQETEPCLPLRCCRYLLGASVMGRKSLGRAVLRRS